jgi:integrase/recombinase XerD
MQPNSESLTDVAPYSSSPLPPPHPSEALTRLVPLVTDACRAPATKQVYGDELRRFLGWYEALEAPPPFSRALVMCYRTHMEAEGRGASAINLALTSLRKLAREAAGNMLLDAGIAAGIEGIPGVPRRGVRTGNWLTLDEAKVLIDLPPADTNRGMRDRAILWLALGSGLRREEVAGLTLGQIQMREGRPIIADLLGKGDRTRTVPLHPKGFAAITAWCERAGITAADALIVRSVQNPDRIAEEGLTGTAVYHIVDRLSKRLGVKVAPHDLRRTFGVLAYQGGSDLKQLQATYGHESVTTTERYLRLGQDLKDAPADRTGL